MADEKTTEMKTLANLRPAPGSHRTRKRLGRGIGSGLGKTAGRGHKGQGQRKSPNVRPGFEGGNMPLYMRLPKRGFTSLFRKEFNVVNLDLVDKRFESGAKVDPESLFKAGLLRDKKLPVKLLGRGNLEKNLNIHVHKVSKGAQEAVSKAGGSVSIIEQRKPAPVKNEKKKQKMLRRANKS